MTAEECLREGKLGDALAKLQNQVRGDPSNAKQRIFLFQLLSVLGQWERAMTQLNVAGDLDPGALAMVQAYREALRCEVLRAGVFAGKRSPLVFGEPEKWIALLMQALTLTAEGSHAESQRLRDEAFEEAPTTGGTLDGKPFEWIADADGRMGPVLEAVINGNYYWVPFHRIREVKIEEPEDLRDLVWLPAQFSWSNGGEGVGLIPTRYADSESSEDDLVRLARKTVWVEKGDEVYWGAGQRMLATDNGEFPLMDVREIRLNTGDA